MAYWFNLFRQAPKVRKVEKTEGYEMICVSRIAVFLVLVFFFIILNEYG